MTITFQGVLLLAAAAFAVCATLASYKTQPNSLKKNPNKKPTQQQKKTLNLSFLLQTEPSCSPAAWGHWDSANSSTVGSNQRLLLSGSVPSCAGECARGEQVDAQGGLLCAEEALSPCCQGLDAEHLHGQHLLWS